MDLAGIVNATVVCANRHLQYVSHKLCSCYLKLLPKCESDIGNFWSAHFWITFTFPSSVENHRPLQQQLRMMYSGGFMYSLLDPRAYLCISSVFAHMVGPYSVRSIFCITHLSSNKSRSFHHIEHTVHNFVSVTNDHNSWYLENRSLLEPNNAQYILHVLYFSISNLVIRWYDMFENLFVPCI